MTGGSERTTQTRTDDGPDDPPTRHRRRRHVIRFLQEADRPVVLTEIARHVAAIESGRAVEAVSQARIQETYLQLHDRDIPALVASDLVGYSDSDGSVKLLSGSTGT